MKNNIKLYCFTLFTLFICFSFTEIKANPLSDSITSISNITCHGMNNGTATVTAYGGTAPYTYQWTPSGGSNATATGLSAGTYTIIVTDAVHNTISATVTITEPNAIIVTPYLISTSCAGACEGATVSGGTSPYTYSWASGCTTSSCCGMSAGSFTLTVVDRNGCTGTASYTITTPSTLTATLTMTQNTNCTTANGTASANVSGGTAPYTYYWHPFGQTTSTISGLSARWYSCTITDHSGCNLLDSVYVSAIGFVAIPAYTPGDSNTGCNSSPNGYATAVPTGGTLPYTYLWSPGGQTTATASGLSGGSYTCVVHDNSGCSTTTQTVIINTGSALSEFITGHNNGSCSFVPNGYATANPYGGTAPYTYLWAPGGNTTQILSGLSAGTYTCTVHDSGGCSATAQVTIINSVSSLRDTARAHSNTSCSFLANGYATSSTTGGSAPYTYLWSPGGQTTATASGLSAGSFTCVVTDNTGCTVTSSCTISNGTFSASITGHNSSCTINNGYATASPIGGTAPFTYLWSPGGQTTATASGLSAGTYTCVVKDNTGCTSTKTTSISSSGMTVYLSATPATSGCNGRDIIAGIYGGHPPYTYLWSPGGQTTALITGLCAGNYCVNVTDSTGCSSMVCDTVGGTSGCGSYSPSICFVTSDTNAIHNEVVWAKPGVDSNAIDSFIIYRGITSTVYAKIGEVSVHNYCYFRDMTSSPNVTSYFYELGVVDTCHTNPISSYHQSILLQCTHGLGNNINLNWNFYVGATVSYYRILRDSNGSGHWQVLDSVPGGVNAYVDTNAPTNPLLRYRIGTNWSVVCQTYLTIKKHGADLNPEGYSNVSLGYPTGIATIGLLSSDVNVYPNPANSILNITVSGMKGQADFYLTDVLGRNVLTLSRQSVASGPVQLNIESLHSGVYFLTIESNGQKVVKKVTKL